ncbi:MAG TPA: hypothetical protein VGM24_07265 [Puia sp.]|jgi:hypothetical protein
MKKIILSAAIVGALLMFNQTQAQPEISLNVRVGAPPVWIPQGIDNTDYYYLPDIQTYYYIPRHQFIYMEGGRWMFSASLPGRYRSYDLNRGYKVVVHEPRPYLHDNIYRERYGRSGYNYNRPEYRNGNGYSRYGRSSEPGRGHAYGHRR